MMMRKKEIQGGNYHQMMMKIDNKKHTRKNYFKEIWDDDSLGLTNKAKNILLLSCFALGHLPVLFFGSNEKMNLSFFVERSTRMDFVAMYYTNAICFLILSYLLTYPKGVDKRFARFVLIVCYLDFLHLLLFASQGFGMTKLALGIITYFIIEVIKKWKQK